MTLTASLRRWRPYLGWLVVPLLLFLVRVNFVVESGADLEQFYYAAKLWPRIYDLPLKLHPNGPGNVYMPFGPVLLLPLALPTLPWSVVTLVVQFGTVTAFHLLTGRSPWRTSLAVFSPWALALMWQTNLDAISALGVLLPGGGALLLLAIKPQAAGLAALPILLRDGWRHAILPALVVGLTLLIWPEWVARAAVASSGSWNISPFPWLAPFGLALLALALHRRDPLLGALATPLLSPYLTLLHLAPLVALILRRWPRAGALLWLAIWIFWFIYPPPYGD